MSFSANFVLFCLALLKEFCQVTFQVLSTQVVLSAEQLLVHEVHKYD